MTSWISEATQATKNKLAGEVRDLEAQERREHLFEQKERERERRAEKREQKRLNREYDRECRRRKEEKDRLKRD